MSLTYMYLENHRPRRISLARYKRNYGHGGISWEEKSSVLRGQGWTKTYFLFIVLYFWMLTSWHLHSPKKKCWNNILLWGKSKDYFIHQFDGSSKTMFSIATPCCVIIRGKVVPRNSQMVGKELNFENHRLKIN